MNIDIRTLSIVLSITAFLQIAAILMHYLTNKTYKGIGWWLIGYVLIAAGFALLPLRDVARLEKPSILLSNILHISGSLALYTGINFFFEKKVNRYFLAILPAVYISFIGWFTYAENNISARIILYSATLSIVSFLIAYTLFNCKSRSITVSANFVSAVFFIQGMVFLFRAVTTGAASMTENFFTPTLIQVTVFMVSLVNINLWMSGFIIMINQRLNEDNAEAREHFEMIFNTSPDAALISRMEDGCITDANEGFLYLSGLKRSEIIGRSTAETGMWVNPTDRDRIRKELSEKGICENIEAAFFGNGGKVLSGLVSAKLITLHGIPHVISVMRDISVRKIIEDKLLKAIDEIIMQREHAEKVTREKEMLLREVHHRIKNNMSTIVGLLSIQSDSMKEPSAAAALLDAGSRVRSMMMLYDKLYRSEGFMQISIKEYLSPLVDEIAGSFPESASVKIEKSIKDFMIDAETLFSIGIIVNELITNMMKYAFKDISNKVIKVTADLDENNAVIVLGDNGNGLPETIDMDNSTGFGLQLVSMLINQIGGNIRISRISGTEFTIEFKV